MQVSFDDREQYVTDNLEEVRDSAEHPLDGRQWWLKADYPWQALAACREITRAVESGDPESCVNALHRSVV